VAAAIVAHNAAFGLRVLPEGLGRDRRRPFHLGRANPFASCRAIGHLPGLGRMLAIMFLYTVAFQSYPSVWAFHGTERFGWDAWWNGISLAAFGVCMVVVQGFLVLRVTRRFGERRTAGYGMALETVTFGFYGVVTSGFWALAFTLVASVAGIAGPALSGLMSNATPDDQQGELQGVLASIQAVGMGLAPMVMTSVFWAFTCPGASWYQPGAPFLLAGRLMAAAVLLLAAPPRVRRPATPEPREAP
jgi:DHA1 family tetracycline resistance protein-like MFS transporter